MSEQPQRKIFGRVDDEDFIGREPELAAIARAGTRTPSSNLLLLGGRQVGKSEILRKSFDRFFRDGGALLPIYYGFRRVVQEGCFASEFISRTLLQAIAFRLGDSGLLTEAAGPQQLIAARADREDLGWVRRIGELTDDAPRPADALSVPRMIAAETGLTPVILLDNIDLVLPFERSQSKIPDREVVSSTFEGLLAAMSSPSNSGCIFLMSGLERPILESMPADAELVERLELRTVSPLAGDSLESVVRRTAARLGVEISDSTTELMVQQLGSNLFYTRAVLDAAAARGASLKTFIDFERIYADEVTRGRIGQYLGALLRGLAPDFEQRLAALEALRLVIEAGAPVPLDAVIGHLKRFEPDPRALLERLRRSELLDLSYGFVSPARDTVLADYVRAVYLSEVTGARPAVAGGELLREKLKNSYRLMMSRYNRSVELGIIDLLSRFDFQNVPSSLFDQKRFDESYQSLSAIQTKRALEEEEQRLRLPQMVVVKDVAAVADKNLSYRLFSAVGFEGGIYSEANETQWVVALINSREPVDSDALIRIDMKLEAAMRGRREAGRLSTSTRWYVAREGFTASVLNEPSERRRCFSTYTQLELLKEYASGIPAPEEGSRATEFELVIPIEDEAELIAARTAEQVARAADFDQESINQIKTALIEACINAGEHSDSPDRRIYQRFSLHGDRLVITVKSKGKTFGFAEAQPRPTAGVTGGPLRGTRGRGLQIIRALMDEVHFERTDDGSSLVMTKFLNRPSTD
jgi:serine/threonine-protein kinase RsbW